MSKALKRLTLHGEALYVNPWRRRAFGSKR